MKAIGESETAFTYLRVTQLPVKTFIPDVLVAKISKNAMLKQTIAMFNIKEIKLEMEKKHPNSWKQFLATVSQNTKPMNQSNTAFDWKEFLEDCGFDVITAMLYAAKFQRNQLTKDNIPQLDHLLLQSLGIESAKERLQILQKRDNMLKETSPKQKSPLTQIHSIEIQCPLGEGMSHYYFTKN